MMLSLLLLAAQSSVPMPAPPAPAPASYDVDPAPLPHLMRVPLYPEEELCQRIGGQAKLLGTYDERGVFVDIAVVVSSGNRNLDKAAISALAVSRIVPGQRAGVPVRGQVYAPFVFAPHPQKGVCKEALRMQEIAMRHADGSTASAARPFAPGETVLLEVAYNLGAASGPKIKTRWYEEASGRREASAEVATTPGQDQRAQLQVPAPAGGWPAGEHRVELRADGEWRAFAYFAVEPGAGK